MAKLVVLSEGYTGRTHELNAEKTTIGRLEDNSFQISEPSVSSHHCEILLKGSEVLIRDLNSTNGTFINGEKISEKTLKPGQVLRLGSIELRLETPESAAAAKTAAAEAKKPNQTRQIPRGVKLDSIEPSTNTVKFDKNSPFAKKTNKYSVIFIAIGVVLGLAILVLVGMAFLKMRGEAP